MYEIKEISINELNTNENIFNTLRDIYENFDTWLEKIKKENTKCYITTNSKEITSLMILKIDEKDSNQITTKEKLLKIRTLIVKDKNKGIGNRYLNKSIEIAKQNNINYIYITCKNNNKEMIEFLSKHSFKLHNELEEENIYLLKIERDKNEKMAILNR